MKRFRNKHKITTPLTKVFVGLSGGVDSAVSAALLKRQGFEVVGVFIKTWHPDFLPCSEEEERRDAMRVAARLDVPFLTFDFEDVYKREVAEHMISEYRAGRTPNPDVMCNKEVKFGAFLKKALAMGADYVATGHYAQIVSSKWKVRSGRELLSTNNYYLLTGRDNSKDQSYFLWTLNQNQLRKILFPVGHLKKAEVRKMAKKFRLPVAEKKDSQGICFLGGVDLKEFLKHYIKEKRGKVMNERGEEIGHHNGVVFFTLGERHGFTVTKKSPSDGPYYVVAKDVGKNVLVVSQNPQRNHSNILTNFRMNLRIKKTNWISRPPEENKIYSAQVRYHGEFLPCRISSSRQGLAEVVFEKSILTVEGPPAKALAVAGQSCVIYDGDLCLGGGVIE